MQTTNPPGDPARHLPLATLAERFARLPAAPLDAGTVCKLVRRLAQGVREEPEHAELTLAGGLLGDAWASDSGDLDCQLTLIRNDIATLIANGQSLALFGDNLVVELDLSYRNLPPGTRLEAGAARLEVTAKRHTGCRQFRDRFGADALRFTAVPPGREQNARGIHCRVLEAGRIEVGSPIRVVSRPGA